MNKEQIYVNGKPFFGRKEEQREFKSLMERAFMPPSDEKDDPAPFIVYLYGDGGMGKSTLLRRFQDMVKAYFPAFTITTIDWEIERQRSTALQGERRRIPLTAVLDSLYHAILSQHPDWKAELERYQVAMEQREQVRFNAESLFQIHEERDVLAPLRGATATFLGKFLRASGEGAGMAVGDEGENALTVLAEMGIQATEQEARRMAQQAGQRLRAKLSRDELKMLLNPNLTLAQQLGVALKHISTPGGLRGIRPQIFFLDTYEIVDANDTWMREVMKEAGANTVWVLAGRNDLVRSRQYGKEFYMGYQDVMTRFRPFDMKQMALGDVRDYFNAVAPEPPLDDRTATALFQATHAIPLAVREAADLWNKGVSLEDIVKDTGSGKSGPDIVKVMTERYHLHCINNHADKYALYALAYANGDSDLLRALLQPILATPDWHLGDRLRELERDYASVHRDHARLHEDAATFFVEYLRDDTRRRESRTATLIDRAIQNLESRLIEAQATLRLIEERHEDETWRDLALKLADFYFWKGEAEGWKWVAPRYVESTVYSRAMRNGLLEILGQWKSRLSKQGKQRIEKMENAQDSILYIIDPDIVKEMLRWQEAQWLNGEGMEERRAILTYWQAKLAYKGKNFEDALRRYESLRGLPEGGTKLKRHVVEGLNDLCQQFLWPLDAKNAKASTQSLRAGKLGMTLDDTYTGILYNYAVALRLAGQAEASLSIVQRHLTLDADSINAIDYNGLGNIYDDLKQYPEAIAAYQEAIRLDPTCASAHNGLGNIYRVLKQYPEAIAAYQEAIRLEPIEAGYYVSLGTIYREIAEYSNAIAALQEAIHLEPTNAVAHSSLAACYRLQNNQSGYREHISKARTLMQSEPDYNKACIEAITGNYEKALRLLKEGIVSPSELDLAQTDPDFESLRDDPRFRALVGLDDPME